jgi:hypothetical protein
MVNEAETAHLAADNFKHPGAEAVSVANRTEAGQELPRGVLQLYKDSQKYPLMAAVARKRSWASSSRAWIRAILLQLNSIVVLGSLFQ